MSALKLGSLLRLLDDETPEVRHSVSAALAAFGGDVSGHLADAGIDLSADERQVLMDLLGEGRRRRLAAEWVVPSGGWAGLGNDWEQVEGMLRQIADFLHDGLTLRLPVPDALDLLAEEYELAGGPRDAVALVEWLFASGRFTGQAEDFHAPCNSDLAWVIAAGRSNPIGLSLVLILTARRLGIEVDGCLFPGRFLCRIHEQGRTWVVDCYDGARRHDLDRLLDRGGLAEAARAALAAPAPPGAVLVRVLRNLRHALALEGRRDDALLVKRLLRSLRAQP